MHPSVFLAFISCEMAIKLNTMHLHPVPMYPCTTGSHVKGQLAVEACKTDAVAANVYIAITGLRDYGGLLHKFRIGGCSIYKIRSWGPALLSVTSRVTRSGPPSQRTNAVALVLRGHSRLLCGCGALVSEVARLLVALSMSEGRLIADVGSPVSSSCGRMTPSFFVGWTGDRPLLSGIQHGGHVRHRAARRGTLRMAP